jgi:hypothetical protein
MAGQISTLPLGLLGLFGIKTDGSYPDQIGTTISPTLEQLNFLLNNCQQRVIESVNVTVIGFTPYVAAVPSGKCWLVRNATFGTGNIAGAEQIRYRGCMFNPAFGVVTREGTDAISSMTDAAAPASVQSFIPGPVFMFPTEGFTVKTNRITTAGNIPVTLTALVYEFNL